MQKFIFLCGCLILLTNLQAQNRPSNNSSLDTLKKGIKAIGNIFKKAAAVTVMIEGIDNNDKNLAGLKQNIQSITGVIKIKDDYKQDNALLIVSYKGKGAELWKNVSQSSKQIFSLVTLSDTAIKLNYKYTNTAAAQKANANSSAIKDQQPLKTNETAGNVSSQAKKQSTALSKGAALLFKDVKTTLSAEMKNVLFDNINFKISKDGKQFITDAESADYPFDAFVYPTDMNKDGKEEIFILFGNSYTSGMTGSNIVVLIADKNGMYKMNLGFPGTLPDALSTSNLGYNDLLIGGPGFEHPIWRWNGKEYDFLRKVKEAEYGKLKMTFIDDVSKEYTKSINVN